MIPDRRDGADRDSVRVLRRKLRERAGQFRYHVFISYSHDPDARTALRLRREIQKIGTRLLLGSRPKVFVDVHGAVAGTGLTDQLRNVLGSSAALVLLASPQSAKSRYVTDELEHWFSLGREPVIAWTDGELAWAKAVGPADDFDWSVTTALSPEVFRPTEGRRRYSDMPLWVRLKPTGSGWRQRAWQRRQLRLAAQQAVAKAIDMPREFVVGEERRRRRRHGLAAGAAAVVMTLLGVFAVQRGLVAQQADSAAESARRTGAVSRLLTEANRVRGQDAALGLRLALAAHALADGTAGAATTRRGLVDGLAATGLRTTAPARKQQVGIAAAGSSGRLATITADGELSLWQAAADGRLHPVGQPLTGVAATAVPLRFLSADRLLLGTDPPVTVPVDADGFGRGRPAALPVAAGATVHAVSADGRRMVTASSEPWRYRLRTEGGTVEDLSFFQYSGLMEFTPDAATLVVTSYATPAIVVGGLSMATYAVGPGTAERLAEWSVTELDSRTVRATALAVSPDGKRVAVGAEGGLVSVWDITDPGKPREVGERLQADSTDVTAVSFSADSGRLAVLHRSGVVHLAQLGRNAISLDQRWTGARGVTALAFAGPDELVTLAGHRLQRWTPHPARQVKGAQPPGHRVLAVGPQPQRLVAMQTGSGLTLVTRDEPGRAIAAIPASRQFAAAAFAGRDAGGRRLLATLGGATGSGQLEDRELVLWDVADPGSPRQLSRGLHLQDSASHATMVFSADTTRLAVSGQQTVVVDVSDPAAPIVAARGPAGSPLGWLDHRPVLQLPDGSVQITESAGGQLRAVSTLPTADDPDRRDPLYLPLAMSATQRMVVLARWKNPPDRTVDVPEAWDLRDPAAPRALAPLDALGTNAVSSAAAGGHGLLATLQEGGSIQLTALFAGAAPVRLDQVQHGDVGRLPGPVFLADDATGMVVNGSQHNDIRGATVWDLSVLAEIVADPVAAACRAAGGSFTGEQWRDHVGPEFAHKGLCR